VLSVGLGGLPLSGGAFTKHVAKGLLGEGAAGVLATLSSIGTTLLMLHFLRCLRAFGSPEPQARAGWGLTAPWLVMAAASLVVPWVLYLRAPGYSLPDALAPYALWAALWPIAVGAILAALLARFWALRPRIPEGDVVVVLAPLVRAGEALGRFAERTDALLRRWPVATTLLLAAGLLFGVALAAAR
jgi:hypothetical protein